MIYIPSCSIFLYTDTAFSWLPHNPESNHTAVYKIYLEISRTYTHTQKHFHFSFFDYKIYIDGVVFIIFYTVKTHKTNTLLYYTHYFVTYTQRFVCVITKPMQNNTNTPTLCAIVNIIKTDSKIYNIYAYFIFIFLFVDIRDI